MSEPILHADAAMLTIVALDPRASVRFSPYTGRWYVEANIEIGDGTMLTGISEHFASPGSAVLAFHDRLRTIDLDHYIVAHPYGERRHYRWNGAAFAEIPMPQRAVAS